MPTTCGGVSRLLKDSATRAPSGQRARNVWKLAPLSGHTGRPDEVVSGLKVTLTGDAPSTSPFQSTTPPGGLVKIWIVHFSGAGSARRTSIGCELVHAARSPQSKIKDTFRAFTRRILPQLVGQIRSYQFYFFRPHGARLGSSRTEPSPTAEPPAMGLRVISFMTHAAVACPEWRAILSPASGIPVA